MDPTVESERHEVNPSALQIFVPELAWRDPLA
jgi:hypothetical protein